MTKRTTATTRYVPEISNGDRDDSTNGTHQRPDQPHVTDRSAVRPVQSNEQRAPRQPRRHPQQRRHRHDEPSVHPNERPHPPRRRGGQPGVDHRRQHGGAHPAVEGAGAAGYVNVVDPVAGHAPGEEEGGFGDALGEGDVFDEVVVGASSGREVGGPGREAVVSVARFVFGGRSVEGWFVDGLAIGVVAVVGIDGEQGRGEGSHEGRDYAEGTSGGFDFVVEHFFGGDDVCEVVPWVDESSWGERSAAERWGAGDLGAVGGSRVADNAGDEACKNESGKRNGMRIVWMVA